MSSEHKMQIILVWARSIIFMVGGWGWGQSVFWKNVETWEVLVRRVPLDTVRHS